MTDMLLCLLMAQQRASIMACWGTEVVAQTDVETVSRRRSTAITACSSVAGSTPCGVAAIMGCPRARSTARLVDVEQRRWRQWPSRPAFAAPREGELLARRGG